MTADNKRQGVELKAAEMPNNMTIDNKINAAGVTQATAARASAPAAKPAAADTSFASSTAIETALKNTPDVRPSTVDRARELINDPEYPSAGTVTKLAGFLADKLTSSPE